MLAKSLYHTLNKFKKSFFADINAEVLANECYSFTAYFQLRPAAIHCVPTGK